MNISNKLSERIIKELTNVEIMIKVMNRALAILILSIVIITIMGCFKSDTQKPHHLVNCLLFIEDLDGNGGTLSGNFGDIVSIDLRTNKRYELTNDSYYDEHPSYTRTADKVLLESKRVNANNSGGLTNKSDLFYLELRELNIQKINISRANSHSEFNKYDVYYPYFDKIGKNFAFLMSNGLVGAGDTKMYYYDSKADSAYIINDTLKGPITYLFSDDDRNIYLTTDVKKSFSITPNEIDEINISNQEIKKIISQDSHYYYYLGDELNDNLLYLKSDISNLDDLTNISINIFNLKTRINEGITNSSNLGMIDIKPPVFASDSIIYFIGNKAKKEGEFDEDIYQLNIKTKVIKKITNNGNIKESLYYCR